MKLSAQLDSDNPAGQAPSEKQTHAQMHFSGGASKIALH